MDGRIWCILVSAAVLLACTTVRVYQLARDAERFAHMVVVYRTGGAMGLHKAFVVGEAGAAGAAAKGIGPGKLACQVTDWGEWSACVGDKKTRNARAFSGGCVAGALVQQKPCGNNDDDDACAYGDWGAWDERSCKEQPCPSTATKRRVRKVSRGSAARCTDTTAEKPCCTPVDASKADAVVTELLKQLRDSRSEIDAWWPAVLEANGTSATGIDRTTLSAVEGKTFVTDLQDDGTRLSTVLKDAQDRRVKVSLNYIFFAADRNNKQSQTVFSVQSTNIQAMKLMTTS